MSDSSALFTRTSQVLRDNVVLDLQTENNILKMLLKKKKFNDWNKSKDIAL